MDRNAFLRCLPYLHPVSPIWPPSSDRGLVDNKAPDRNSAASGADRGVVRFTGRAANSDDVETVLQSDDVTAISLFRSHAVSIEPVIRCRDCRDLREGRKEQCRQRLEWTNIGPAFFRGRFGVRETLPRANAKNGRRCNEEEASGGEGDKRAEGNACASSCNLEIDPSMCPFEAVLLGAASSEAEGYGLVTAIAGQIPKHNIAAAAPLSPAATSASTAATSSTHASGSESQSPVTPNVRLKGEFSAVVSAPARREEASGEAPAHASCSASSSSTTTSFNRKHEVRKRRRNRREPAVSPNFSSAGNADASMELYFRFDKDVFFVDFSRIEKMEIDFGRCTASEGPKPSRDGDRQQRRKEPSLSALPPSLLIIFEGCAFRVFAFVKDGAESTPSLALNESKVCQQRKVLEATLNFLTKSLTGTGCIIPPHLSSSSPLSSRPNRQLQGQHGATDTSDQNVESSDPSSHEGGQREERIDHTIQDFRSDLEPNEKHVDEDEEDVEKLKGGNSNKFGAPQAVTDGHPSEQAPVSHEPGLKADDDWPAETTALDLLPQAAKRRKMAHESSWSLLRTAISLAQEVAAPTALWNGSYCSENDVARMLTAAATRLGHSYGDTKMGHENGTGADTEAEQAESTSLQIRHGLEATFAMIFPAPRTKNPRSTTRRGFASPSVGPPENSTELRRKAEDLIRKHKLAVSSMHMLAVLPGR